MVIIPQELIIIILEKLMKTNPFLVAKVSKYWYYEAMPKIWDCLDLNYAYQALHNRMSRSVREYEIARAYDFYNKFIKCTTTLKIQKESNCLKFITKLIPYYEFYPGTVINIIRKCPNLEELDFSTFERGIPYEAIVRYCPKIHTIYVKRHQIPSNWLYPNITLKSL
jgi:hypothetical protein